MTKQTDKQSTGMKGGVRRPRGPRGTWSYVIDIGLQDAQRCNDCGRRQWVGASQLDGCPRCSGSMRGTKERRVVEQSGFKTEKAAKTARAAAITKQSKGNYRAPERLSLADYLRDVWLPHMRAEDLKTTTREGYERHVADHLIGPAKKPFDLALLPLADVTFEAIRDHYAMLAAGYPAERKRKGAGTQIVQRQGLSTSSIRRIHATIHRALNVAVQKRLLEVNPAAGAGRKLPAAPSRRSSALQYWEPNELQRFLGFVDGMDDDRSDFYPLWFLLSHTGIRRGEAAALLWEDFDAKSGLLWIRRNRVALKNATVEVTTPKTKGSKRTLELDAETVQVLDRRHRAAQAKAHLLAGPYWSETGYLFTDKYGQPLHPNAITWEFRIARELANQDAANEATPKAVELSPLTVHGMRHTFATIALQSGIPVTVVSKYLGHSSVTTTLNTYSHVLRGAQRDLANTVANAIRRGAV